jgi:hypothetical protein
MEFNSLKPGCDVIIFNRDKQEIGEGKAVTSRDGDVGVLVKQGVLYDELLKCPEILIQGNLRYTHLHFSEFSGGFLGFNFTDELSERVSELTSGITAVNEFDFKWGICNERFSDYPGFRSALSDLSN